MKGQPYTPSEDEFITRRIPRKGYAWVAKQLNRTTLGIYARAAKLGVRFGELDGWTRINHLAAALNVTPTALHVRAKTDGVYRRIKPKQGRAAALVPNGWADQLLADRETRIAGDQHTHWLTVKQAAALWRVAYSTANRAANGKSLLNHHAAVDDIEKVRANSGNHQGQWLLEPYGVHRVARQLERERQLAKQWVSTKSISIDENANQARVAELGKEKFGGQLLFIKGRVMCHVTPTQAVRLRNWLRADNRKAA